MAADKMQSSEIDWNYPNLFTKERLLKVIKSHCIDLPNLDTLDKDELIDIYNRCLLPLPQRKYRSNCRGVLMTNKQILLAKRSKSTANEVSKNSADVQEKPMPRFMSSYNPSTESTTQVKPPVSCINFDRKTIRLNSRSGSLSVDNGQSTVCERVDITPDSKDESCTTESSNKNNHCTHEKSLEENLSPEEAKKRPSENNVHHESDVPEKKKKIIPRITWP
ncbi:ashwinashwin-like [Octopus vulgaris]|uniref:Ashwinashwin-like n=1 Tax=Octopus vulgaris TaxID=6645 RepID=A0AA36FGK1_OCTVU|nr:ashwinashwin-like [Octopus vulgaris]